MNAELKKLIDNAKRVVFLGGAGVSTESGIPDFRSETGIYAAQNRYGAPPEVLLSHDFFWKHTEKFYKYYRECLIFPTAKPNAAHHALAELERQGKLSAVVTQNIDGLHQAAGSKKVLELHGSIHRNYCTRCNKFYPLETVMNAKGVPKCSCGGIIKPDVVLYGEGLDSATLSEAINQIRRADLLIIGGTSLVVHPAAGLMDFFGGENLVIINLTPTARDVYATLCIRDRVGEVLKLD
ncbi:MAG: NAD-dependent protein deacylase [Clostridia bacterium]|nr:NAD-dependent protein deacylase [Clostridia bacterium]